MRPIESFWLLDSSKYDKVIHDQNEFYEILKTSDDLKRFVYYPQELKPINKSEYKIENKKFYNISFAFTSFKEITFENCIFENCRFNHSAFLHCRFLDCNFKYCNMFKVIVEDTYLEPNSFKNIIPTLECFLGAVKNANVCVSFFQQLIKNSRETGQIDFCKNAEYYFRKWKGLNYIQKKISPEQGKEKEKWFPFLRKFIPNCFFYLVIGYGYRMVNFLISTILMLSIFTWINYHLWDKYNLHSTIYSLPVFDSKIPNLVTSFYYTYSATANILDSQIYPQSDCGICLLIMQNIFGFVMFSALIAIILKKFVR